MNVKNFRILHQTMDQVLADTLTANLKAANYAIDKERFGIQ